MKILKPGVSFKISLLFFASLFISIFVNVTYRYSQEVEVAVKTVESETQAVLARLSKSLVYPLWSYDEVQIRELLSIEMQSPYILAITLSDRGRTSMGLIRNRSGSIIPYSSASLGLLIRSQKDYSGIITYNDVPLAELKVYSTMESVNQEIMGTLEKIVIQGALTAVISFLFLFLGLRITIVNPLLNLSRAVVDYGKDFLPEFSAERTGDEVQSLEKDFLLLKKSLMDYNQELLSQLHTERITGLQNRRKLFIDLESMEPTALLLVNIDEFKQLNDFYGNAAGDFILASVGKFISSQLESSFTVYKMPADEFALITVKPGFSLSEVENLAKFFLSRLSDEVFNYGGTPISLNVTIGMALYRSDYAAKEILYMEADMALRYAKRNKKPYFLYDPRLNFTQEMEENIHLSRELKEALRVRRVVPFYQPILHNQRHTIEKYECLVRMYDQEGKIIPPLKFLGVAKKSKLYHLVTRAVLETAFKEFENRHHDFSINLSLEDILDNPTKENIISVLNQHPQTASRLVFELLESEGIENYSPVRDFIEEVKEYGCKIAIDDFGSGYSNFAHILKLDVDILKLDASLIKNLPSDPNSQIVTRTITNFSKELGFLTIAEFVSDEAVFKKVQEFGIDYSQGYFIGPPKSTP